MEDVISLKEKPYKKTKLLFDDLKIKNIWSYGIGHFMNDICASSWFFFFSYYLIQIIEIDKVDASLIILCGQIADAISTPIVGILSDKTNSKFGKRTPWYLFGTILVGISFTLIFFSLLPETAEPTQRLVYYSIFAALFNIGWASVQVSHMALLPSITLNKKKKDYMTRIRTGFTFFAQTLTLVFSFVFFRLINDRILQYKALTCASISIGFIFSIIFLYFCQENVLTKNIFDYNNNIKLFLKEDNIRDRKIDAISNNSIIENKIIQIFVKNKENDESLREKNIEFTNNTLDQNLMDYSNLDINSEVEQAFSDSEEEDVNWIFWMKKPDFYYYIVVYMFVRLSINITSTIIPFYMEYVLGNTKTEEGGTPYQITICLLVSTFGSIFNSLFFQDYLERKSNSKYKRLNLIFIANLFVMLGCIPLFYLDKDLSNLVYILAFFWGIGFSQGLSCVSSLINDVVGSKGNKGAFVYGSFSFADKFSCGFFLLYFLPIASQSREILRISVPFFPPIALFLALLFVWLRIFINNKFQKKIYHKMINKNKVQSN